MISDNIHFLVISISAIYSHLTRFDDGSSSPRGILGDWCLIFFAKQNSRWITKSFHFILYYPCLFVTLQ